MCPVNVLSLLKDEAVARLQASSGSEFVVVNTDVDSYSPEVAFPLTPVLSSCTARSKTLVLKLFPFIWDSLVNN